MQNWIPLKGALELWQAAIFALSVGVELRVKENVASLKLQRGMEDIYDALIQNSRYSNICTLSGRTALDPRKQIQVGEQEKCTRGILLFRSLQHSHIKASMAKEKII